MLLGTLFLPDHLRPSRRVEVRLFLIQGLILEPAPQVFEHQAWLTLQGVEVLKALLLQVDNSECPVKVPMDGNDDEVLAEHIGGFPPFGAFCPAGHRFVIVAPVTPSKP